MSKTSKVTATSTSPVLVGGTAPVIYADRIVNISIGPGVTKLQMGQQIANQPEHVACVEVVMPTFQLIEGIQFILKQISEDNNLKGNMTKMLEIWSKKLQSL